MNKDYRYQLGFSLLEVMIALTIFSIFITMFVTSIGYNLSDSTMMREELLLRELCLSKINEVLIAPPELVESLTLKPKTKDFEHNKDYHYTIEYKKIKMPNIDQIMGKSEDDEDQESGEAAGIQQHLFKNIKKFLEDAVWQVKVTVQNKQTEFSYDLSTWLINEKAKPEFENF
ncbi:MAG: prepilin-type N-terminal cleavage/methylation domain-containing protein [Bacteriovoracaceae bacterium]|nr:prepilin-type N-terminal cleavage/methylation domain-containing protein [Bacteriovoracaceae bacterium]